MLVHFKRVSEFNMCINDPRTLETGIKQTNTLQEQTKNTHTVKSQTLPELVTLKMRRRLTVNRRGLHQVWWEKYSRVKTRHRASAR